MKYSFEILGGIVSHVVKMTCNDIVYKIHTTRQDLLSMLRIRFMVLSHRICSKKFNSNVNTYIKAFNCNKRVFVTISQSFQEDSGCILENVEALMLHHAPSISGLAPICSCFVLLYPSLDTIVVHHSV